MQNKHFLFLKHSQKHKRIIKFDKKHYLKNISISNFISNYTLVLISNAFFLAQPQSCLTFSWIEVQILLRCCLIDKIFIMLRHFLYLLYLCLCLDLNFFYVVSMWSVFHIHLHFHHDYSYNLMNTDTNIILLIFRVCPIIFGW